MQGLVRLAVTMRFYGLRLAGAAGSIRSEGSKGLVQRFII